MLEIIKTITETIYKDNILKDSIKIISSFLFAYFFASYNFKNPKKTEIEENQFNLVYLPMYLLTKQYIPNPFDSDEHMKITYFKKINKLIYNNYQYVYPKTIKLLKNFNEENTIHNLNIFVYQIETDYNVLKRKLGYPTDSIICLSRRLNKWDKAMYFLLILFSATDILFIVDMINSILNAKWFDTIICLFAVSFMSLFAYIIRYSQKH